MTKKKIISSIEVVMMMISAVFVVSSLVFSISFIFADDGKDEVSRRVEEQSKYIVENWEILMGEDTPEAEKVLSVSEEESYINVNVLMLDMEKIEYMIPKGSIPDEVFFDSEGYKSPADKTGNKAWITFVIAVIAATIGKTANFMLRYSHE